MARQVQLIKLSYETARPLAAKARSHNGEISQHVNLCQAVAFPSLRRVYLERPQDRQPWHRVPPPLVEGLQYWLGVLDLEVLVDTEVLDS